MTELVTKWDRLWKDFETARKSEWLKAKESGKFNQLIKERVGYKNILESLEVSEVASLGLVWPVLLGAWLLVGLGYSTVLTPSGRLLRRSAHA